MENYMNKVKEKAFELVQEAKSADRRIYDIELGEVLVRELSSDPEWEITGNNKEQRMYHILHLLVLGLGVN